MCNPIEKLKQIRETNGSWYSIANLVAATIESNHWKPGQAALIKWMSSASEVTGFSLNTLGRMLSVYEFINPLAPSEIIEAHPDKYPFSSLEILKRINVIAPSLTTPLLDAIGNKEISMRDLRIKLNTLQHEQPVGDSNRRSTFIKKSADFEKDVLSTLQSSLAEFQCPANSEFSAMPKRKSRMAFEISIATPNALAFEHESIATSSTGFKIYYADNESIRKNIPNLIYQCCYMSTFLSRLILILPDTIDPDMGQKIADVFSRTKHLNVGVALLKQGASKAGTDGNFIFLSRPFPKMEPTPDCRQIVNWNSILVRADLGSDGIPTDIEKE